MSVPSSESASNNAASTDEHTQRARRAQRLARMFERWDADNVSDEPEWDINDIEPLGFRVPLVESETDSNEQ
ncbi:MAG: hypothetical protein MJE77_39530 [Proteobacteria bacterium]|nr:hypothetical protein [Pseudomonadota bacterium]